MAEAPFDLPRAQRWFAVECNNAAWDLLENSGRTAADTEVMLHAAHASVHHWLAVGNDLNRLRGMVLLAIVYASAGRAEGALHYAEQALALSDSVGDAQSAFDRATVQAAVCRAYLLCGDGARTRAFFDLAQQAAKNLDADDRPVFDQLCPKMAKAVS